jgi:hypothetical protein
VYVTAGESVGFPSTFDGEIENTLILLRFQLFLAAEQMEFNSLTSESFTFFAILHD